MSSSFLFSLKKFGGYSPGLIKPLPPHKDGDVSVPLLKRLMRIEKKPEQKVDGGGVWSIGVLRRIRAVC